MSNNFYKNLDLVVDFATLGEYRVIGERDRAVHANADQSEARLWTADVEWQPAPRARAVECRLPRLHDRAREFSAARERVRA